MMKRIVEIDTSQPFESVKEAVSRYGGRTVRTPSVLYRSLPPDVDHKEIESLYFDKMEDHTSQLERVLMSRERETLEVLKELEETKKLLGGLKVSVPQEDVTLKMNSSGSYVSAQYPKSPPSMSMDSSAPPLMDLDQARVNLNKTSIDLAVIRASVESLNRKMTEDVEVPNAKDMFCTVENQQRDFISTTVDQQDSQSSYEAKQFKKMVETSRYEVMKAMSEIEKTKLSIKMAEMRLDAARKIEEAAKAVEAIAFAERSLNLEEYTSHFGKAKELEEICKTKFIDGNGMRQMRREMHYSEAASRKLKQTTKAKYKNNSEETCFSYEDIEDRFLGGRSNFIGTKDRRMLNGSELDPVEEQTDPVYQSTTSIGDILSRKLVVRDDSREEKRVEAEEDERQEGSLSQMIREQSGLIFRHVKSMKDGRRVRHFFAEKKKFGFIHVGLPKNRNKKNRPCS